MTTIAPPAGTVSSVQTLDIRRELDIAAAPAAVFASILAELGPEGQILDGSPFPRTLEPWPGGRWFRDLGNNSGHLWGHVQVIKPPTLIELCGPMFMSYPGVNFIQYRLTAQGAGTHMAFVHRAMGLIPADHAAGVNKGWDYVNDRIKAGALRR